VGENCGLWAVLEGCFGEMLVLRWCFCGEAVVGCVAGVVIKPRDFQVPEIRHV